MGERGRELSDPSGTLRTWETTAPPFEDPYRPPDETRETDVDDDFDWDTELGVIDPGPAPEPPRRWVPPPRPTWPELVRDERLATIAEGDEVGEFVRACRASAGLSQRELAAAAGVPQSTVARLEAGRVGAAVRLGTVLALAAASGVRLAGVVGEGEALLHTDREQRHRDRGGRMLPAHLENQPLPLWHGGWWGDDRHPKGRRRPLRGYQLRDEGRAADGG